MRGHQGLSSEVATKSVTRECDNSEVGGGGAENRCPWFRNNHCFAGYTHSNVVLLEFSPVISLNQELRLEMAFTVMANGLFRRSAECSSRAPSFRPPAS